MAVSPTKLCSTPPAPYQSLPHTLKSPRLTTTEQSSRGSSRPSSSGSSISSHLNSLKSEAQAKAVKPPIFDPDHFTPIENQDWLTSLKESFDVIQRLDFPQLGDQFETSRDFKRACLLASWLRGHSMHVWHNRTNGLVSTYSLACSKVHRPPKGVSCSFRITAVCDKSKPTGHRTWKVTDAILQHCNHDPQPGDYDLCGAEQRCQSQALAASIVSRSSKPESDASSGKHGVHSSTSGLVEKGSVNKFWLIVNLLEKVFPPCLRQITK
ncbi:hypothetical protein CROQUDRAFT_144811 [Cronartium quercuum f. sp. fusiforme G11]|uniref:Uncharacterized protein n=1 Tax=Cronartium quercuum f. sp. fusiforme G11 TaxID=708437 RepID=A0A9P6NYG3_9BASI|nr:hypothetical protein CROQUDRAFT_144811 [Cronartium quercuum f. sp. fusiforme G11]